MSYPRVHLECAVLCSMITVRLYVALITYLEILSKEADSTWPWMRRASNVSPLVALKNFCQLLTRMLEATSKKSHFCFCLHTTKPKWYIPSPCTLYPNCTLLTSTPVIPWRRHIVSAFNPTNLKEGTTQLGETKTPRPGHCQCGKVREHRSASSNSKYAQLFALRGWSNMQAARGHLFFIAFVCTYIICVCCMCVFSFSVDTATGQKSVLADIFYWQVDIVTVSECCATWTAHVDDKQL
jgi:hypothetical protein